MLEKEEEMWALDKGRHEMTSDERLKQFEEQAERGYDERMEDEKEELKRLRRDRENADSRESWQNGQKETKNVAGEQTKAYRSFAMPHATVFTSRGKTNFLKTAERRKKLEQYLKKTTTVSAKERKSYVGALECFKRRDGSFNIIGLRKMNRLLRTGETGGDSEIKRAVQKMKEKGIIKENRDIRKVIGRHAMSRMKDAMMKRSKPTVSARERTSEESKAMTGPGMRDGVTLRKP